MAFFRPTPMDSQARQNMKMFEPKVYPAPQSRGDFLHHLQQFSRPKSLQKPGIL